MATLTFQRKAGIVILRSLETKILGTWKAHNSVVSDRQPWPDGTWVYETYNAHPELASPSAVLIHGPARGSPKTLPVWVISEFTCSGEDYGRSSNRRIGCSRGPNARVICRLGA